ncbi:hypothetical protein KI387_032562 [Taxus chinensis]|uniref:ABC transporter domain-containing protein n=1 Tax=Taxus chinensis TaxID=29808 RepID=A0AA38F492_TAXCH|nr:hypothetical protein KI387_032562 [Taxus chinensis]
MAGVDQNALPDYGDNFAGVNSIHDGVLKEALAIQKLPTCARVRTAILEENEREGGVVYRQVDVSDLRPSDRQRLMNKLIQFPEEDNEKLLKKLRGRINRVGLTLPTVEVRFENLEVEAVCYVGGRALPTLWNAARNVIDRLLECVHLSPTKRSRLTILKNINGIIKPSRMALLLGPPGSGKSTLLQALSGNLDRSLKVEGDITYNGHRLHEFVPQKTSAYIHQNDVHISEMTTRETLNFSACCQGVGTRYELLMELTEREKEVGILPDADIDTFIKGTSIEGLTGSLQADYILKILGLDVCADTKIGDAMQRGISGGQKKRVTTGEMIVGPTKTLFMDDISTGLDSSTTFQIVKCLQQFVHIMESTILMSLLQPAPETFELFDDIILLSEGQIVYQGPRQHILEFFEGCGFRCPERKSIADFLQEPYSSNTTIGLHVLQSRGLFGKAHFYWIAVGAMVGFTVLCNLLLTIALTYLNPIGKAQTVISEEKLTEIRKTQQDVFSDQNMQSNCTKVEVQLDNLSSESRKTNLVHDITQSASPKTAKRGMILPFHPLTISFRDVQYFVDMTAEMKASGATEKKLQLLKDMTGAFRPGVLTALMGVSGAGKTTLMDVLSGRKTGGYIEGDICISGFPKVQQTFARVSGYCEQTDIHSPQITVRESVLFSAYMRLSPEIDAKSKQMFVDVVMDLVELDSLKDTLVGLPGVSGLSTEQRKRLTIAVELVANPSIIFMDEPTSGLDARAAAIVMRAVRNTVDTGRTVVCTIHQPSIDIFEAFDELLLMKQGGQTIYAGPLGRHSINVIEYFQAIQGIARIKDKTNPATWMLEISSASAEQRLGIDFAEIYKDSPLYERNLELVEELSMPAQGATDLNFRTQFSQSPWTQFVACLWKKHWTYWRSPDYNLVRLFFTFISALFFGTIYWQLGTKIYNRGDLFTVMGALYGSTLFLGINNSSAVQPIVAVERTIVIEIPYIFLQTVMYGLITYFMIGFQLSVVKIFWYIFTMFFTFLYFTFYGMLAVSITPNYQVAAIVASAFYDLFNLFSGFLIPRPDLPKWWQWYYWICPTSWTLTALTTSQYGDLTKNIAVDGIEKPINVFLKDYFGYHHEFLGVVAAVLVIFPAFFAILFAYSITAFNFQRR